ncbi:MAG: DUF3782 domain-containing protein, partial [Deltaproteobacteria bacterium]|nr:DUF3782 domain-containing protein [Deltaproteobacteria bacterium]
FEQADQHITEFQAETGTNFEQVDQRFEQVDQRFEQVDQRITEFQTETGTNFEQVDQRFEQVDQRITEFQTETRTNFEQVDQRITEFQIETRTNFEQVDNEFSKVRAEMAEGFENVRSEIKDVVRQIDRLGSRWGIRNEDLFRATIASLLEESFGVAVETRHIKGEQFDVIISDGQHILIEITASVGRKIQQRLERKRELYTQETGIEPARFILATASIHSHRAESLREVGFEVIEPEEDE